MEYLTTSQKHRFIHIVLKVGEGERVRKSYRDRDGGGGGGGGGGGLVGLLKIIVVNKREGECESVLIWLSEL